MKHPNIQLKKDELSKRRKKNATKGSQNYFKLKNILHLLQPNLYQIYKCESYSGCREVHHWYVWNEKVNTAVRPGRVQRNRASSGVADQCHI
jgi:hypothetical protein